MKWFINFIVKQTNYKHQSRDTGDRVTSQTSKFSAQQILRIFANSLMFDNLISCGVLKESCISQITIVKNVRQRFFGIATISAKVISMLKNLHCCQRISVNGRLLVYKYKMVLTTIRSNSTLLQRLILYGIFYRSLATRTK